MLLVAVLATGSTTGCHEVETLGHGAPTAR